MDTIVAVATPCGEGGIGIVRVSGPEAAEVVRSVFRGRDGIKMDNWKGYSLHYGYVVDWKGAPIDEVLVAWMPGPRSYTAEDVAEFHCHGGNASVGMVLQQVLTGGTRVRVASRGEFTRRAFINGRLDLAQAEAVLDVIEAGTGEALEAAVKRLGGELSGLVRRWRDTLLGALAAVEASVDFPDEVDEPDRAEMGEVLSGCLVELNQALEGARRGIALRDGVSVAIIGKPNVGKSSLLNALVGEERALVSEVPGTTRDVVDKQVSLGGAPARVMDTAGLRETADLVEQMGISHTRRAVEEAQVVILVVDGSRGLDDDDLAVARTVCNKTGVLVVNKVDMGKQKDVRELVPPVVRAWPVIRVSAIRGWGVEELKAELTKIVTGENRAGEGALIGRSRQRACMELAVDSLGAAVMGLRDGHEVDLITGDIRIAHEALGELVGESVADGLLDRIFNDFCVGK